MCRDCHRVYHQACIKPDLIDPTNGFICAFCRSFQNIPAEYIKAERQDLNQLLQLTTARIREKMPGSILQRSPPPPAKNPYLTSVSGIFSIPGSIYNKPPVYFRTEKPRLEKTGSLTLRTEKLLQVSEKKSGEQSFF